MKSQNSYILPIQYMICSSGKRPLLFLLLLLHTWDMPDPRSSDKRVLALLDAAYERFAIASGLAASPAAEARRRFVEIVADFRRNPGADDLSSSEACD